MMKKSISLIFGILFTTSFAACNASNATSEAPLAVQPTDTTSIIFPTSTAPFVPTIDPLTPSAIAQFFHTLEATTVTPDATAIPNYEECSQWELFTVDKNWALCDPRTDPVVLVNKSNQFWEFSYKGYYGKEILNRCTRLLYATVDGNYLYFSLDADCIMVDAGFVSSISVFRMNLNNGDTSEILKASYDFDSYTGNYYTASISPTGRRLAYITDQDQPLKLNLLDLTTSENRSFPLEENYRSGGMFSWSEDGTKLVFMLESEKDNDHFISMVFLDLLRDDSMVTFIKEKEFRWIASRLEVMDNGIKITPNFDTPLFYNIETGILSSITQ